MAEGDPAPWQFTVPAQGSTKWNLVFGPDRNVPTRQAMWLFNQETGELYERGPGTGGFVLVPK